MHFRKLAVATAVTSAIWAQGLSALGLGEVKLNSTLNEPLDAEIRLLQVRDLSEQEILIGLAGAADFKRASVDRTSFISDFKFELDLDARGGAVVKLSTSKPVTEPYLNFLIETRWPAGRLLREYTLLMDLPVFTEQASAPVRAPRQSAPILNARSSQQAPRVTTPVADAVEPEATDEVQMPVEPKRRNSNSVNGASSSSYGPIGSDDTLWAIALKVRPGRGVSVQQTMLALQRLNPEAFIDNNINLLKRGKVLRVPTANDIESLNARQAISQVAQQNNQWSGNSDARVTGAPLDAGSSDDYSPSNSQQRSGRVKLASSDNVQSASSFGAGGRLDRDGKNQLSQAQEQLDKAQRENRDLNSRISDLESQIDTMERLVSVTNEQLAVLQQASKQSQGSGDAASADAPGVESQDSVETEATAADATDVTSAADATAGNNASEEISESVAPVAPVEPVVSKVKTPSKVVSAKLKPEPGLVDMLLENLIWIGGGLVALIVAIWALLRRRRDDEGDEQLEPELVLDEAADLEVEDSADIDLPGGVDSSESVSEADVYIAYGKFDKAEVILNSILTRDPNNVEACLKMMEVYAETGNFDGFERTYQKVILNGNESEAQRAEQMRDAFGLDGSAGEIATDLDLEVSDFELESTGSTANADESTADALDAFNFDLSDTDSTDANEDFSLDDYDLGGDLTGSETAQINTPEPSSNEGLSLDAETTDQFELATNESAAIIDEEVSGLEEDSFDAALKGLDLVAEGAQVADLGELDDEDDFELPSLDAASDFELEAPSLPTDLDDDFDAVALNDADLKSELDFEFDLDGGTTESPLDLDAATETTLSVDPLLGEGLNLESELSDVKATADDETGSTDGANEFSLDEGELSSDEFDLDVDPAPALQIAAESFVDTDTTSQKGDGEGLEFNVELDSDFDLDNDFDLEALDKELDLDVDLEAADDSPSSDLDLGSELDLVAAVAPTVNNLETASMTSDDVEASSDIDEELSFLADSDEVATKLDLARAYMDMGDKEGAREILQEVVAEGDGQQKQDAEELISRI